MLVNSLLNTMFVSRKRKAGDRMPETITFTQYRRMCYFADLYPIKVPACFAFLGMFEHIKLLNLFRPLIEEQRVNKKVYCLTARSKIGHQWYWYSNFAPNHVGMLHGFARSIQRIVRKKICAANLKKRILWCDNLSKLSCVVRLLKLYV